MLSNAVIRWSKTLASIDGFKVSVREDVAQDFNGKAPRDGGF